MEKYKLINLDCAGCAIKIEENIRKMEEVKFVNVNFATLTLTIDTDNLEKVKERIKELEPEVVVQAFDRVDVSVSFSEHRTAILKAASGLTLMVIGLLFKDALSSTPYHIAEYVVFAMAYLIVGWSVVATALKQIIHGQIFGEHFLMTVATMGAFAIHAMPEAVSVMLFYVVGELFQDVAVGRSRKSIRSLLEIKPDYANLKKGKMVEKVSPESVNIGDVIVVKAGEKIPLDGIVIEGSSFVDTAILTGESVPRRVVEMDEVLAGMINHFGPLTIEVKNTFDDSSISKILELVENATSKKAQTERFITTFAKYYTPVVVFVALALAVLPPLLFSDQTFGDWIYRALVVLVVSCPCALVISIPLGYFGGIGCAAKKGILVKGSNFLDALTQVKTVVFDKTGTLTKGEFKVSEILAFNGFTKDELLEYAAYAEAQSNHPVAKSILDAYGHEINHSRIRSVEEISGLGIKAIVDGKALMAGNDKFLHEENIAHPVCVVEGTVVHLAIDALYAGYILISDTLKADAFEAIKGLKMKKIRTVMLTGDNQFSAAIFAKRLGVNSYYYDLLPGDKVKNIERLMRENREGKVAFVGDGINDAPVIARADVGMAMGALGSDAAIETADIVLMTDSPLKVVEAIDVARNTRIIVWQNIIVAIGVKLFFIVLGVLGVATMWEAVFGDMGVALLAVFNALRILKK